MSEEREELVSYKPECDVCHRRMDTPFLFVRTVRGVWDAVCADDSLAIMRMSLEAAKIADQLGSAFEVVGFAPVRIDGEGPRKPERQR